MMDKHIQRRKFDSSLSDLRDEWDELLLRSSRPTIYSTFDYVSTSFHHFRQDEEAFCLLLRDGPNGRLLAIFPLSIWNAPCHGVTMRTVRHGIPTHVSDIDKPYPIIDRDHEETCWTWFRDYFRKDFRGWDIILYDELFLGSLLNLKLEKLFRRPRYWTSAKPGPKSPLIRLDGCWEDFQKAHRNMRAKTRRMEKRLGDGFSYVVTNDPADMTRCLAEYIDTENMGWKAGTGVTDKNVPQFYQELLPKLAAQGQVYFGTLYDGDTVVSIEISYAFANRVYFALGTYNPVYRKLSPGTVSTAHFIQFFFGKGYVDGDFLAGFAHYVEPWASSIEKTVNITIRRMGWKNGYLALRHLEAKTRKKAGLK